MIAIFDRTQSDVDYARDNPSSELALKGARNHTDLIRITGNIHQLCEILATHGYPVTASCKTDWKRNALEPRSEIYKIYADIEQMSMAFPPLPETPETPLLPWNHFEKLNDVERIIFDLDMKVTALLATLFPAGTFMCGQASRLPRTIVVREEITPEYPAGIILSGWAETLPYSFKIS